MDRILSDTDRTRIEHGLRFAAEQYGQWVKQYEHMAKKWAHIADVEGDPTLGPEECKRLAAQFDQQRADALELLDKLEQAEAIKVIGTEH